MARRRLTVWIASCIGVALLLSSCFGGGGVTELTVAAEPTPEPIYEPAGSPGLDAFFPLDEQLTMLTLDLSGVAAGQSEAATAGASDPTSTITTIGLGGPTDAEVKTGLYGGTAENTCDPERLIQYLLDNPTKGQVWADVQGIKFVEIPDYIRTLTPQVLTEDRLVLNHGFDPKGHAIPIVSTLAEGTAVLVDENGDVRTRCYCGNPILPYTPTTYMPPKCLSHFAVVYTAPNDRKVVESVPRSVNATLQVANYEGVDWKEVTWGDSTGWVRADEANARYCKPAEKPDCVSSAQVLNRPGTDDVIGEIDRGYISVLAPNVEGWSLIKFADRSGWIQSNQMGGQDCTYEVVCVASSTGTWTRPVYKGTQIIANDAAQGIELTGQSYIDQTGTYLQAYVTYPGPTRIGYVDAGDLTELPATECKTSIHCSHFDFDATVYEEASGTATYGTLWFAEVAILSGPVNNRYEIDWGTATGWVDVGDLQGSECVRTIVCVQIYGVIYEPIPDSNGTRTSPAGPVTVEFTGRVADNGTTTFKEFTSSAVAGGPGWLETQIGYNTINYGHCDVPICERPYVWNGDTCGPPPTCEDRTVVPPGGGCCPNGGVYFQSPAECQVCPDIVLPQLASQSNVVDDTPDDCCPGGYELNAELGCTRYCVAVGEGLILDQNGNTIGGYLPGDLLSIGGQQNLPGVGLVVIVTTANNLTGFIQFNPDLQLCAPDVPIDEIECTVGPNPATVGTPVTGVVQWSDASILLEVDFDWKTGNIVSYPAQTSPAVDSYTFPTAGTSTLHISWSNPATGETGLVECDFLIEDDCREDQIRTVDGCFCRPGSQDVDGRCVISDQAQPTVAPQPTATTAPQPTAVPPPTATPVPQPTVTPPPTATPVPVCRLGVAPSGECFLVCNPGDLLSTQTCKCVGEGTRIAENGIQCEIVCPAGQVNISVTECGPREVPTPTPIPTTCNEGTLTDDGRCRVVTDPVRTGGVCEQGTDIGDGCRVESAAIFDGESFSSCPEGSFPEDIPVEPGVHCVRIVPKVTTTACPSGFSFEGEVCVRYDSPT